MALKCHFILTQQAHIGVLLLWATARDRNIKLICYERSGKSFQSEAGYWQLLAARQDIKAIKMKYFLAFPPAIRPVRSVQVAIFPKIPKLKAMLARI